MGCGDDFIVLDKEGKEVGDFTFILIPAKDDAAVEAIIVYAASVAKANKDLAIQLMEKMEPFVRGKKYLEILYRVAQSTFFLSGREMGERGN